ncbi:hypothetical protein [Halomonas ramblicola]|uniref:hypothetical protein n=1 Tax=Halomonas ramblicola TaxID=747349 RepID=UPI0025B5B55F|nr:hypothetical protein [Halomonas ramblicola]MDN3520304.1 hypothetical protein [Halomonas ramblicola]
MQPIKPALVLLLTITLAACVSWSARTNQASELRLGQPHYGQLASGSRLYRLEIERPGTLTIEAITPTTRNLPGGYSARLLDDAGQLIVADEESGEGANFRIQQALTPGVYYLELRNDFKCSSGSCISDNMSFKLESRLRRD